MFFTQCYLEISMTVAECYLLKYAYEHGYSLEETMELITSGLKKTETDKKHNEISDKNWVCYRNDISPQNI